MPEDTLVSYLQAGMKGRWRGAVKHADAWTTGIADMSAYLPPRRIGDEFVSITKGTVWLELKAIQKWPANDTTAVQIGLEEDQRKFALDHDAWVLLRVKKPLEYLLFGDLVDIMRLNKLTRDVMRARADRWEKSIDWEEFETVLRRKL